MYNNKRNPNNSLREYANDYLSPINKPAGRPSKE